MSVQADESPRPDTPRSTGADDQATRDSIARPGDPIDGGGANPRPAPASARVPHHDGVMHWRSAGPEDAGPAPNGGHGGYGSGR
jgi:hypothetical protein